MSEGRKTPFSKGVFRPSDNQLLNILKRVIPFFAGTNLHDIFNVVNEDLAVADVTGIEYCLRGVDDLLNRDLRDDNVDLNFREERSFDGDAAVVFEFTLLYAAAEDVRDGHAGDADVHHRGFEGFEFDFLADDFDFGQFLAAGSGSFEGRDRLDFDRFSDRNVAGDSGNGGAVLDDVFGSH